MFSLTTLIHTLMWYCTSYASHERSRFCKFVMFGLQGSTLQTTSRRPSATLSLAPQLIFSSTCGRLTWRRTRPRRYGKAPKPHLVHAGGGDIGRYRGHVNRPNRTSSASLRNSIVLNEVTLRPSTMNVVGHAVARGGSRFSPLCLAFFLVEPWIQIIHAKCQP